MENSQPKNQKPKIVTSIPGKMSQKLRSDESQFISDGLQGFALMSGIAVERSFGNIIQDVDGNEFLDIIGGIGVNGIGHAHPKFITAVAEQVGKGSVGSFTTESRVKFFKLIDSVKLKNLNRIQLYSSGAEAVESALRLAKNASGKWEMVSFNGGFHGKTHGALSLMGSDFKSSYGPHASGSHIIPYANCYRCPLNTTYPGCGIGCLDVGRKQLKASVASGVAAFVIEPVQGTAGNIIPPKEFLPGVHELAREFDALFIADEMITGFGRTGTFWGSEHSGVVPDLMTIGKQFGGGFPVSGIITSDGLSSVKPWGNPSGSSSSYGGNPLASAAAYAATRIIIEENLVLNSKVMGDFFLEKLKPFVDRYSFVGEVRGLGLMLGIEMVKNKKTKESLSKKATSWIFTEFLNRGLLTMAYASSFRIQPAMTIDNDTIENIVSIMFEVFDLAEERRVKDF
ncbi:MAG: aminotransferase class III-fold pyridoxal phosphate-dependent enzyme [Bacteriovorax sp.]|jgi:4-aminobutyrate aminotransferase-like enzyme